MRTVTNLIACSSFFLACGGDTPPAVENAESYTAADAELALSDDVLEIHEARLEPQNTAEPPSVEEPVVEAVGPNVTPTHTIVVRSGENLVLLAEWAKTTPTELADLNEMDVQATLFAGGKLSLSLSEEGFESFEDKRGAALDSRLDRYIENRGGLYTVEAHSMRSGETVWGVSKDQGELPMWVVSAFNEDLDLNRLGIGDIVTLPVMVDTVQASLDAGIEAEKETEEAEVAPF